MIHGTLRVVTPDGQIREYPLETTDTVLGRSQGVGINVDHVSVSRRHAQLRVEADKLRVQDLGSASGTYVGGQRIESQQSHLVSPGQMIRFGDCEAVFVAPIAEEPPPPPPEPVTPVAPVAPVAPVRPPTPVTPEADHTVFAQPVVPDATPLTPTPSPTPPPPPPPAPPPPPPRPQERPSTLAVTLASPTQPVAAGGTATATIVVQNRGEVVDQVSLSVPDLDPSWVQVRRTNLSLVPGARDEVTIVLKPPKNSTAVAGDHQFAVAAASAEHGNEVRVLGKFTILPFEQFEISMRARNQKGRNAVTLHNSGNAPITRTIVAMDDEESLKYQIDQEEVELGPGEEKTVQVQVKPRRRNPFGQNKYYRFRVEARAKASSAAPAQAPGSYTYRAPLRRWKLMLLGLLIAGLAGGGYWAYRADKIPFFGGGSGGDDPLPTVAPTTATDTTTPETPPPDTPIPTPTIEVGGTVRIVNSPSDSRLRVRDEPSLNAPFKERRLLNGEVANVVEGPIDAGGYRWWRIEHPEVSGWAAEMQIGGTGDPVDVGPWMEPGDEE